MKSILETPGAEKWALVSPEKHQFRRDYYISSFGRMLSKDKETGKEFLLKPTLNKHNGFLYGFLAITPSKKGHKLVHRMVAESFISGRAKDEIYVTHKDGNKLNNHIGNLRFITEEEHRKTALKNFNTHRNNNPKNSKLTLMQVKHLKLQLKRGNIRKAQLARMYNISDTQINRIERGENWGEVKV